jgi:hypothetical protein
VVMPVGNEAWPALRLRALPWSDSPDFLRAESATCEEGGAS